MLHRNQAVRVPAARTTTLTPCRVLVNPKHLVRASSEQQHETSVWQGVHQNLQKLGSVVLPATLAVSMLLAPPSLAEPRVVRLPASSNPEIFSAQRTMVEAWTIVGESFVDPYFNALDWPEELRQHMIAAYTSESTPGKAWDEINAMLSRLGDPYTRRIEPEEYQSFRVSADGELQGIGLLIANELTNTGHLRVLAPIKGSPADRAGILPGDEVISINGEDTTGWSGDRAAKVLRGQGGTEVKVRLQRRSDGIPGVPSRPEPIAEPYTVKEVALRREVVQITPVFGTLLAPAEAGSAPVGYVRLSQFSGNAAKEMRQTVAALQQQGAGRFILDLRSNPGGLVKAGVDVAAMFLDGEQTVFTVASRESGMAHIQTTESTAPALAHEPLVILVDSMSASASEIVSGALHDNNRALVMGDTNTYGKGRIQSVFELQDGSALFVTVARYQTPDGTDIDMKGIRPDRACAAPGMPMITTVSAPNAPPARNAFGAPIIRNASVKYPLPAGAGAPGAPPLFDSQTVQPTGFQPGIPLDPGAEVLLREALQHDRCVLAAEKYLETVHNGEVPPVVKAPAKLTPAQDLYLALIQAHRSL